MQFFLDTGDIEEIKEGAKLSIIDGVTTNPTLIAKTKKPQKEIIQEICKIINGPISAEVISTEYNGMLKEAKELAAIAPNVVIKLPLTESGIRTCSKLSADGIKTNLTLCFSSNQALLAAKVGATYISPFIGRLDDIGAHGLTLIQEIRNIYDNYGFTTQILAASIRHADHVKECSLVGADVGTMPLSVIQSLFKHPLTDLGLEKFLADHHKSDGL